METHPVPQNISSYEFRLVGDMTLKQFLQLAGGIVVALLIFRLPLIGIIKYPLTFLSAVTGALMAFVPINGRPFSTWIFAFIKAVYSPTEFIWRPVAEPAALPQAIPTPPTAQPPTTPVITSFSSLITSKLQHPSVAEGVGRPKIAPATPTQTTSATVIVDTPPVKKPPVLPAEALAKAGPAPTVARQSEGGPAPDVASSRMRPPLPPLPVATPLTPQSASVNAAPGAVATSLISPPTSPNILAGLVTNPTGQPLNGITVEIVDTSTGIPARALRTNRLGQFQIAIPLTPGTYNIIAEKEGLVFAPVSVQVKGSIIPPIVISAKT